MAMNGKKKMAKKMRGGGSVMPKKMAGGGMAKMAKKKMRGGGMMKKKMMRGGMAKKKGLSVKQSNIWVGVCSIWASPLPV